MLSEIYIENLAVIREATIPIFDNMNVFTGETGAGKSILINGINAILGQRITKDIVRTGAQRALIVALFRNIPKRVVERLAEFGIAYDGELSISREISADGGSIARVNSRTSTVSVLKEIGEMLITIHGQHDSQVLLAPEKHLDILDRFGCLEGQLSDYKESFKALQETARQIKQLTSDEVEKARRIEILTDTVEEISILELEENEDALIDEEFNIARNSAKISKAIIFAKEALDGDGEVSIGTALEEIAKNLELIKDVMTDISPLLERITSARIELLDIAGDLSAMGDDIDLDGERFAYLTERREALYKIKHRYGPELSDVIAAARSAAEELAELQGSTTRLDALRTQKQQLLTTATEKAKALSLAREKACESFISKVTAELTFLDMPNVKLAVSHQKGKLTAAGMDTLELLISANLGEPPKPIAKIASGGELSRIMLALKTVIADKDDIPVLIFDEIDAGVSGRAAQKIGIKLGEISTFRQVLCVTHLAQIAVMADNHLLIEKKTVDGRTVTAIERLDFEGKKREIARIMGGGSPSALMLQNAEELLLSAKNKPKK